MTYRTPVIKTSFSFLIFIFFLSECKKTEKTSISDPLYYHVSFPSSRAILMVGDTVILTGFVSLDSHTSGVVELSVENQPNINAVLSVNKGIPPFYFSVKVTATQYDDTPHYLTVVGKGGDNPVPTSGNVYLLMYSANNINDACRANIVGTDSLYSTCFPTKAVIIDTIPGVTGGIYISDLELSGDKIKAYYNCDYFSIPMQRLKDGSVIRGYNTTNIFDSSRIYIEATITDSSGYVRYCSMRLNR